MINCHQMITRVIYLLLVVVSRTFSQTNNLCKLHHRLLIGQWMLNGLFSFVVFCRRHLTFCTHRSNVVFIIGCTAVKPNISHLVSLAWLSIITCSGTRLRYIWLTRKSLIGGNNYSLGVDERKKFFKKKVVMEKKSTCCGGAGGDGASAAAEHHRRKCTCEGECKCCAGCVGKKCDPKCACEQCHCCSTAKGAPGPYV